MKRVFKHRDTLTRYFRNYKGENIWRFQRGVMEFSPRDVRNWQPSDRKIELIGTYREFIELGRSNARAFAPAVFI